MPANTTELEKRLWEAADNLRANSRLRSSEYSVPVLGLIFLAYADSRFEKATLELSEKATSRRGISAVDYQAKGVMYLPDDARYASLLALPESVNVGAAVNEAMRAIERENPDLKEVLPKTYNRFENGLLVSLLRTLNPLSIAGDLRGDAFGKIYEYFLGKFAMTEGQKGGEFFTPTSIVELIVGILEPYKGRIYDPACGSGGMFVQSAHFLEHHHADPSRDLSVYGQEKTSETVRLCRMNLAVHGLSGDIKQGNTYYEDLHSSIKNKEGGFDFVMANPPFNVNGVDKERLVGDPRYPFGLPSTDNANYLWIQHFYSALNDKGRAGFVMANSASDARGSELELRKALLEAGAVDVMVLVGSNFFYTVTLPCTLWFLDRGKAETPRADTVLFLDARHIYKQVDRAHREFTEEQLGYLSGIVKLYRGEALERADIENALLTQSFPGGVYRDVAGLCKVATLAEIAAQGYSLNPGRYVGVTERPADDFVFAEKLEELNEELETLNLEARALEEKIAGNVAQLLEVMV